MSQPSSRLRRTDEPLSRSSTMISASCRILCSCGGSICVNTWIRKVTHTLCKHYYVLPHKTLFQSLWYVQSKDKGFKEVNQITSMIKALLLSHQCESISPGRVAPEGIYPLWESQTLDEQEALTAGSFSVLLLKSLRNRKTVMFMCLVTCRIHSESSKTLRKESSGSDEVALGAQALSSFLKEAFTCRVSAKSTGTSSQLRQESTLRPCREWERQTWMLNIPLSQGLTYFYCFCLMYLRTQTKALAVFYFEIIETDSACRHPPIAPNIPYDERCHLGWSRYLEPETACFWETFI